MGPARHLLAAAPAGRIVITAAYDPDPIALTALREACGKEEYYTRLVEADSKRHNDYDGRGVRSLKNLVAFCDFMLRTSIDQVEFMENLLSPEHFMARADHLMNRLEAEGRVPSGAVPVFRAAIAQGKLARADVATLSGKSTRSAVNITGDLLGLGLLKTEPGPCGQLFPAFPAWAGSELFPRLYPAPADPSFPPGPIKIEIPIAARGQNDVPMHA